VAPDAPAHEGAPIFELDRVSLSLEARSGRREILREVGFRLDQHEILSIVGASGTGKTSLLRVIAGLTAQSEGSVRFRGRPVSGPQEGVAIVFQDYANALLQWRTVEGNVALAIERETGAGDRAGRVAAALERVKLSANRRDFPWQLSGGMQQRVQIARALVRRPSVILMDEPFASLDAMTKAALQDELLRLREDSGVSIVFITHDIEEAIYLGDRVALLGGRPGRIQRTFEVRLGFPRSQLATRALPEFLRLRQEIHAAIGAHE